MLVVLGAACTQSPGGSEGSGTSTSSLDLVETSTSAPPVTTTTAPPVTTTTAPPVTTTPGAVDTAVALVAMIERVEGAEIDGWDDYYGPAYASLSYERGNRTVMLTVFPNESTVDRGDFLFGSGSIPEPDEIIEYGPVTVALYAAVDGSAWPGPVAAVRMLNLCSGFDMWLVDVGDGAVAALRSDAIDYLDLDPCQG